MEKNKGGEEQRGEEQRCQEPNTAVPDTFAISHLCHFATTPANEHSVRPSSGANSASAHKARRAVASSRRCSPASKPAASNPATFSSLSQTQPLDSTPNCQHHHSSPRRERLPLFYPPNRVGGRTIMAVCTGGQAAQGVTSLFRRESQSLPCESRRRACRIRPCSVCQSVWQSARGLWRGALGPLRLGLRRERLGSG